MEANTLQILSTIPIGNTAASIHPIYPTVYITSLPGIISPGGGLIYPSYPDAENPVWMRQRQIVNFDAHQILLLLKK